MSGPHKELCRAASLPIHHGHHGGCASARSEHSHPSSRDLLTNSNMLSLFPGAALLIGQYYKRSEFYIRFSYFICFALLGSAFSGVRTQNSPSIHHCTVSNQFSSFLHTPFTIWTVCTVTKRGVGSLFSKASSPSPLALWPGSSSRRFHKTPLF